MISPITQIHIKHMRLPSPARAYLGPRREELLKCNSPSCSVDDGTWLVVIDWSRASDCPAIFQSSCEPRSALSEGLLCGTNRLRRDLARNIAAYPAFLPILLSLQEGLFSSLYLARFSRNQR